MKQTLREDQKQRYLRNLVLPEIGEDGQKKLLSAKILVIGAGGLGSPIIFYLAAAGVGNIGIIDDDVVELSNLQRQIIHNNNNLGQQKVISAEEKISALNPDCKITPYALRANHHRLTELVQDYDLVIDACDNFSTRFIINRVCFEQKKTLIFGAVKGFLGQVTVFKSWLKNNPCYECFNPNSETEVNLPLSEKGILGAVAGNIGALQAVTTIKEILQLEENLVGKMLFFDFLKNNFRKVQLHKSPSCKLCGHN